jgi:hypothetical protein
MSLFDDSHNINMKICKAVVWGSALLVGLSLTILTLSCGVGETVRAAGILYTVSGTALIVSLAISSTKGAGK